MSLPENVPVSPISIAAMLENIINRTDLVETAEFLLEKYREFYVYSEEVVAELGKRRIDVNIDIALIANNEEMLKFVFDNADILMKPYTVKFYRRDTTKIRKKIIVQKTPEENKKIIANLKRKKLFWCI